MEIEKPVDVSDSPKEQKKNIPDNFFKIPDSNIPRWEREELSIKKMDIPDDFFKLPDSDIPRWKREDLEEANDQENPVAEKMDSDFNFDDLEKRVKDTDSIDPWIFGDGEQTSDYLPRKGGEWTGKPGDSTWKPDKEKVPQNPITNPDGKTWGEILDKYGIDGIPFKDGEPDFSDVSKGTVEIDDFSDDRDDNFDAADEKLAEQRGCTKEEVRQWRKDHHYTWHERSDMKTMDKVPTEVHGNVPHEGGISAKKKENENG